MLQDDTQKKNKRAKIKPELGHLSSEGLGHALLIKIQEQSDGSANFNIGAALRVGEAAAAYTHAGIIWLDNTGGPVAERRVSQLAHKANQGVNAAPLTLSPFKPARPDSKTKAIRWLSLREAQMLLARHQGMTAKEAGTLYNTSHRTVEKQLENARNKLGVNKLSAPFLHSLFSTLERLSQLHNGR